MALVWVRCRRHTDFFAPTHPWIKMSLSNFDHKFRTALVQYILYIRLTTKKYVCTIKNLKTVAWKYKYIQRKTAHWNGLMNIYRWSGNWPRCSLLGQLKLQFLMYRWLQFLIDGWLQFLGLSRQSQTLWTESSECWLTLWELEFYSSIFEVILP